MKRLLCVGKGKLINKVLHLKYSNLTVSRFNKQIVYNYVLAQIQFITNELLVCFYAKVTACLECKNLFIIIKIIIDFYLLSPWPTTKLL